MEKSGKAEKLFREMGRKIDEIAGKIMNSEVVQEIDIDARLKELKKTKEELQKELSQVADENKESVQQVIDEIDLAFERLRKSFKETFEKNKE